MTKEVVVLKYGGWRNLRAQEATRSDSLWWKDLKEVWRFQGWKGNFEDNIVWDIENKREISLWEDRWLGNVTLREKSRRLFSISSCREAKLRQAGGWNNNLD